MARLATPVLTGPEGPGDPDLTSVLWGPSPFSSVGRPASQHVVSLPQPSAPPPGLGSRSVFSFCWEGWAGLALAGPGGLRPPPPSSVCRSQRPGGPARSGCGRVHSAARPPGRLAPPVPREAWPAALRGDRLLLQASRGSASHSGSPRPWSGGSPGAGRGGAEGPHEGAGKSGLRPPPDGLHILAPGVIAPWKITVRKMNPQRPLPTRGRPVRPGGRQPLVWRWLECVCRRAGGPAPRCPPVQPGCCACRPAELPSLAPFGAPERQPGRVLLSLSLASWATGHCHLAAHSCHQWGDTTVSAKAPRSVGLRIWAAEKVLAPLLRACDPPAALGTP